MYTVPSITERSIRTRVARGIALYMESRAGRRESLEGGQRWREQVSRNAADLQVAKRAMAIVIRDARVYLDQMERIMRGEL